MTAMIACLLVALVGNTLAQGPDPSRFKNDHGWTWDGSQFIMLDTPSFLTTLHSDMAFAGIGYVFGQDKTRFIDAREGGFMSPNWSLSDANLPYLSINLFHNDTGGLPFTTGPIMPDPFSPNATGYSIPVAFASPGRQGGHITREIRGATLYSAWTDWSDPKDICTYYVGWTVVPGVFPWQVRLTVIRTHINTDVQGEINYNNVTDILLLDSSLSKYIPYNAKHKPWILPLVSSGANPTLSGLMIVDPATRTASRVIYQGNDKPLTLYGTPVPLTPPKARVSISTVKMAWSTGIVYIGWAAQGWGSGGITGVDSAQLNFPLKYNVSFGWSEHSRPQAIAIDDVNGNLYVGFNGGNDITRLDMTLKETGFQNVPFWLTSIQEGLTHPNWTHVWFITNEQHSKVFRVNKTDFCSQPCHSWLSDSHCSDGTCVCIPGFEQVAGKYGSYCAPSPNRVTITKEERGPVAAMAVLFVLSFLAAVAAGVVIWRSRQGSLYQPIHK